MTKLFASPPFAEIFAREDPFLWLARQDGELFRDAPARRTLRFELAGKAYFVKLHGGVGWREILKNLLSLRLPVLDARQEKDAVAALIAAEVPTLDVVAWGVSGRDPARRRSFLITREIASDATLDDLARRAQGQAVGVVEKRRLVGEVAELVRRMHAAGINHRDLYLVHFLLGAAVGRGPAVEVGDRCSRRLHLIDLHRAGIRPRVPRRWLIKDLGSLHFSAMAAPLTARDRLRFLRAYRARPLRAVLAEEGGFWRAVERRGQRLWRVAGQA